jgi:anti-sigma B factor antagonist
MSDPRTRNPGTFEMQVQNGDAGIVLRLSGEFDLACEEAFRDRAAQMPSGAEVLIDLRELTFIDSTGIRLIVELWQRSNNDGIDLAILPGPPDVQRVFQITGLDEVLPISNRAADQTEE